MTSFFYMVLLSHAVAFLSFICYNKFDHFERSDAFGVVKPDTPALPVKKRQSHKKFSFILGFLSLFVLVGAIICFGMGVKEAAPYVKSNLDYIEIRKNVMEPAKEESQETIPDREINWKKLHKINEDIVGWIYVPDTKIDYPIMAGDAKNYYLKHNYKKEYNILGSIFLPDQMDLNDAHLLFYGHNMKSGRMFGQLSNYSSKDYWSDHKNVYVYTPTENRNYQVFSAFSTTTKHKLYQQGYVRHTPEYEQLLDSLVSDGTYSKETSFDNGIQTLTLSTCVGRGGFTDRYVVNCVWKASEPVQSKSKE